VPAGGLMVSLGPTIRVPRAYASRTGMTPASGI